MASLRHLGGRHLLLAVLSYGILGVAPLARAQEAAPTPGAAEGTEKERLGRAKKEQAEARKAEEAAKVDEERTKAAEEERKRLEALRVDEKDRPPEEKKGFFLGVAAFGVQVSGADRGIARIGDVVTAATTAEQLDLDPGTPPENLGADFADAFTMANERVLSLTYDTKVAPELEIGYRRERGGAFSLRYFQWSGTSSLDAASSQVFPSEDPSGGALVLGGIDNQGMENTTLTYAAHPDAYDRPFGSPRQVVGNRLSGADSVSAGGKLDVKRWDVLFTRTALARKRLELTYRLGLSLLDASRSENATFVWSSFDRPSVLADTTSVEDVSASCETKALGPVVGIAGRFGLSANRRWSVRLGLEVSGLKADKKLRFRDAQLFSQTGLPPQPAEVYQETLDDGAGDFATTIDADAALEFRWTDRLRVGLGYRRAWWKSVLTEERFPDAANTALLTSDSLDLDLGGPYIRLGVFF